MSWFFGTISAVDFNQNGRATERGR